MAFRRLLPLFLLLSLSLALPAAGKKASSDSDIPDDYQEDTATPAPAASPTPTPAPAKTPTAQAGNPSSVIFIHKPMPSPSWGKVLQYHREISQSPSEKSHEILHEFLFQDDQGIIRTAIYHENANGEGYWEVWVWDQ